jgi:hypothetical protein
MFRPRTALGHTSGVESPKRVVHRCTRSLSSLSNRLVGFHRLVGFCRPREVCPGLVRRHKTLSFHAGVENVLLTDSRPDELRRTACHDIAATRRTLRFFANKRGKKKPRQQAPGLKRFICCQGDRQRGVRRYPNRPQPPSASAPICMMPIRSDRKIRSSRSF